MAFKWAFSDSEKQKISIFSKSLEITIKTVIWSFLPEIYVFRVENFQKHYFICENDRSLDCQEFRFSP